MAACGGGGSSGSSGGGASDPAGVISNPSGNVAGFPDDGAVSYTLNITRQNIASPTSSWNVTATTTGGTCSITPPSVTPLTYGSNNQTTTSFDVTFTGTATVGGSCVVNFAVNEDEQIRNLRRTVTFNAELAPTLVASLIGSGENIPASGQAIVALTATKRDGSNTPAVAFLNNIVSAGDPSCTATLADAASQYSTAAGISTAVATYNVRPTIIDAVSNCGVFRFNATEGSASGSTEFSDAINFLADGDGDGIIDDLDNCPMIANPGQSDLNSDGEGDICDTNSDNDADTVFDAMDVDVDGDGLIEIHTVAQLNMMRYSLDGSGLDDGTSDNDNTTGGDDTGCGGGSYANGTDITTCNGYEQMANFDLNDLPDNAMPGNNWEPVGTCGNSTCTGSAPQLFSGVFSGNNFTISNMFINVATERFGVGFFGAISTTAELQNVHIRGGNITAATSDNVGGLVGFGVDARISNSSVTLAEISGADFVSGLVGQARGATISSSVATVGSIIGIGSVGSLFGSGDFGMISSSVAIVGSISGAASNVGGLVGWGDTVTISSSVAIVGSISGEEQVGGLAGQGSGGLISSSVAIVGSISGTGNSVGGLAGTFNSGTMSSSVAIVGSISGTGNSVGGLAGNGNGATIRSSVAITNSINGSSDVGGLLGLIGSTTGITASYWDSRVSFVNAASNTAGSAQTTAALTTPTDFTDTNNIYTTWGDAWCDSATGEFITDSNSPLAIDANRVWDLGTSSEYPAITCAQRLLPLDIQREASRRALAGILPLVD